MNKLILFAVIFLLSISITSCNKNDNPPPSNTDHITKSPWKFSAAKAGGTDVTANVPACFKDNTMVFVANGTGTISEGSTVCSPASPSNFTWTFQNNGNELNMSTPIVSGGSGVFTIVTLNETILTVSQMMTIAPYPATNVELTFIH